jgi:hypothetical protein
VLILVCNPSIYSRPRKATVEPHDNSAYHEEDSEFAGIFREYSRGHNALSKCGYDRGITRGNKRIGTALLVIGIGSNLFSNIHTSEEMDSKHTNTDGAAMGSNGFTPLVTVVGFHHAR